MSWGAGEQPYSLGCGVVVSETERAVEVQIDGCVEWVPKSVIHDDSEVWEVGQEEGEIVVQKWWAEKGDRSATRAPSHDEWEEF